MISGDMSALVNIPFFVIVANESDRTNLADSTVTGHHTLYRLAAIHSPEL